MYEINDRLSAFFDSFTPPLSNCLRENRLERMELLLKRLGNPEKSVKMIHLAGSKGKGTTSSMMAYVLKNMGYKTGLYLSPHVFDIRERFTLSTEFFPDELYLSTLDKLSSSLKDFSLPSSLGPEKPTTFELYTAYAYLLFKEANCQYAVIETGLGGRLDATNTIDPIATCFTRIEKEHTAILGNRLEEIAKEKAGIMRINIPSFTMEQEEEAYETLIREGEKIGSPLFLITPQDSEFTYSIEKPIKEVTFHKGKIDIHLVNKNGFTDVEITDLAFAVKVLSSISLLKTEGRKDIDFSEGFSLPGRFQLETKKIYGKEIRFVFDGAHTVESIKHLLFNLETFHLSPLHTLVFSTAQDKDYSDMADKLLQFFNVVIVTDLGKDKKSNPDAIYAYIKGKYPEKEVIMASSHREALLESIRKTENHEVVVVTGSFYLVDKIFREFDNISYERN